MRFLFCLFSLLLGLFAAQCSRVETNMELHIVAGQSNAQGIQGDAAQYPVDVLDLDPQIPFFYNTPGYGSSAGRWVTLGPQTGRFPLGHFGLEVTFARALRRSGAHPAIFKYSQPTTSLAKDWKAPGENGAYDAMCRDLQEALRLLKQQHGKVKVCSFTWIQGESDAETDDMAAHYEERLVMLVRHIRSLVGDPDLPVILGIDEQHPWVRERPMVVAAQKKIVAADKHMAFLSMYGLEKFDVSHLTPAGLVRHGERLYDVWTKLEKGVPAAASKQP